MLYIFHGKMYELPPEDVSSYCDKIIRLPAEAHTSYHGRCMTSKKQLTINYQLLTINYYD